MLDMSPSFTICAYALWRFEISQFETDGEHVIPCHKLNTLSY